MTVDDKKWAEQFNPILSNQGQKVGEREDDSPSFSTGDSSFSFRRLKREITLISSEI